MGGGFSLNIMHSFSSPSALVARSFEESWVGQSPSLVQTRGAD
jgi:hypothetical protein